MFERTRIVPCLAGVTLAAALAACGGGTGPTDNFTPSPTPTPCTQTTLEQDSDTIPGRTYLYFDFSVPDSGRLDMTIDWTNASSPIGVYLVPANTCTLDEINARSCNFLIRSETPVKPRKISIPINAGNYRWIIANFSEAQESVSIQIVLSKGACAALGVAPSASDRANDAWPAIEHAQHH